MKNLNKRLIKFKNVRPTKSETQLKKERIAKNIEQLYKKYYDAYKGDYDTDGELNEAKKKKFDHKLFELVDKRDEESKLDEETKHFIKEIKEREKGVDKKGFSGYFDYETSTLVNKLVNQNTQDFKKIFDEIKQQKIKLNKDERNIRKNKDENDRLNMILSLIDKTYRFLSIIFCQINTQMN